MKICKIDGCNNKHSAIGYCRRHYDSFRRHGDPLIAKPIIHHGKCLIDGCTDKHEAKGYCKKHYKKFPEDPEDFKAWVAIADELWSVRKLPAPPRSI